MAIVTGEMLTKSRLGTFSTESLEVQLTIGQGGIQLCHFCPPSLWRWHLAGGRLPDRHWARSLGSLVMGTASISADWVSGPGAEIMDLMPKREKNMRKPIQIEINGHRIRLVSVGHVCRVLNLGSRSSIIKWEARGFPLAPFRHLTGAPNQNRLYPITFAAALAEIRKKDYCKRRLDGPRWDRFIAEATAALADALEPLGSGSFTLPRGVTGETQACPRQ
jgi:hypothetical protein